MDQCWDAIGYLVNQEHVDGLAVKSDMVFKTCREAIERGNKLMFCGNGGSASQCSHAVGELVGAFKIRSRLGLPAISLCSDINVLTAVANDYGYKAVFSRQVQALGKRGDVLVCLSTSGDSMNCIEAVLAAHVHGIKTVALTGQKGGRLKESVACCVAVPSEDTPRIQEVHLILLHLLCEELERHFFPQQEERSTAVEENFKRTYGGDPDTKNNEWWPDSKEAGATVKVHRFIEKYMSERWSVDTKSLHCDGRERLADVGADSLDAAELVLQLEDEFDVDIPDSKFQFSTVKEVVELVVKALWLKEQLK